MHEGECANSDLSVIRICGILRSPRTLNTFNGIKNIASANEMKELKEDNLKVSVLYILGCKHDIIGGVH